MGNCTTCDPVTPGFVPIDCYTRERLPIMVAPLDYDGIVAFDPCPQCNQARRTVALSKPYLLGRDADRDGYPKDWVGDRDHPSWKPDLRGGVATRPDKLKSVATIKALLEQAGRKVAKQGELLSDEQKARGLAKKRNAKMVDDYFGATR